MSTKNTNESKLRRGVGVYLVDSEGRFLFTQRGPKARHEQYCWEGPGGEVDKNETFEDAAKRELLEEIGVNVKIEQLIYESKEIVDAHGVTWHSKVFTATSNDVPQLTEPDKCMGFGWFTIEDALKLNLASYSRTDLEEIIKNKDKLNLK